ncbi:tetratricopeptide repeat protein [candidate division GN15 bacterium]|nr:tetratricopeptide repeat protein [candidate division GN15 bacterium]
MRSFQQAQRLDPDCAMAYWGEALSFGPHINAGMSQAAIDMAWDALQTAQRKATNATEKERAYIEALTTRYEQNPPANRRSLDRAYVNAMRELAERYPDDPDAQALFAEALMITTAWDYWEADGSPNPTGEEITSTLLASMDKQPYHPGTNHFYIHTVETHHPERGEPQADRMRDLVPAVGHLQHMPSHVYMQIGRYADASLANEKAIAADRRYLDEHGAHGMYRISYIPHNALFLCYTTLMEGRGEASLEATETIRELTLDDYLYQPGYGSLTLGHALRYVVLEQFGRWQEILDEPAPPAELEFPTAMWHYARGMAYLRTGQPDSARTEWQRLDQLITDAVDRMDVWGETTTRTVLRIAAKLLESEIAAAADNYTDAIAAARDAVAAQDALGYYEPPPWYGSARHTLGALLLEAGRAAEAERVYREDLRRLPENGWALFGLYQALDTQEKTEEAAGVSARFDDAWSRADVELTSSRL